MTPKEKAEELVTEFQQSRDAEDYNDVRDIHAAIRCALITVNKILEVIQNLYFMGTVDYWQEVKKELKKL